ncbi:unnamed protein product [Adineta ricciae]|uniref:Uncharacterized protein n=1 Tax=Adineta ricciae TaxID=249248 RepID=A0A816BF03_ADIRI|nr:unnamed protein product [Adineta ricciae]CAF1609976.1 unnamed protein product [Adineta ricciae]
MASINNTSTSTTHESKPSNLNTSSSSNLVDTTLLAKARKAHFDDLPSFSRHNPKDAERFLQHNQFLIHVTDDSGATNEGTSSTDTLR